MKTLCILFLALGTLFHASNGTIALLDSGCSILTAYCYWLFNLALILIASLWLDHETTPHQH